MSLPRFLAPLASLALAIAEVFRGDSDGGKRVTRAELRALGERLHGLVGEQLESPIWVGDDVLFAIAPNELRPAKVVRVWGPTVVNLQVFLDGTNDARHLSDVERPPLCVWWVTSVSEGQGAREWRRA